MLDPGTSEVWMTAFGEDFGGMCQGNNKTNKKGTDAIFVMDPKDVPNIPKKTIPIESESQLAAT
jgi:hypothetical protein